MVPRDTSEKFLTQSDDEFLPVEPEDLSPVVDWESHVELLPLATWTCTANGTDVFVNRACRRLLGVTSIGQLLENRWVSRLHPTGRESYLKSWNRFLKSFDARFKAQVRWTRPDSGRTITLEVRVQRLNRDRFQGWIRKATAELALSKLERIAQ
jgi:PAS domain-containing protein